MARPDVPLYVVGDIVDDGQGSWGYVRACKGQYGPFLKVLITRGPRTSEWIAPYKLGKPQIDWTQNGPVKRCQECEREFRTDVELGNLLHILCRTCQRDSDMVASRMSQDASPSHGFGSKRPRVYRRDATDEAEDMIAEETRGR